MTPSEYVANAIRTESPNFSMNYSTEEDTSNRMIRILHGALGCVTESGELADTVKKTLYYGKEFDWVNAVEEIGDILWYIALLCSALNIDMEEVMERNISKLRHRYPEKFTEEKANNRNLEAERKILELEEEMYKCNTCSVCGIVGGHSPMCIHSMSGGKL